jgi:tRNA threonylcarbamoyladenosine biosynthesis protein TsaE
MKAHSIFDMQNYARKVVQGLSPKEREATVVALSGELGAGKTTFVQGAAVTLGVTDTVASPTFIIERVYLLNDMLFARMIHIDAYRLESPDELSRLGWDEIVADPQNIIFVEWAERVKELIPKNAQWIYVDTDERKVLVKK